MMNAFLLWFIAYLLPGFLAYLGVRLYRGVHARAAAMLIIHLALFCSILMSLSFIFLSEITFPLYGSAYSLLFLLCCVALATVLLGWIGVGYALSSFMQEMTLITITVLLLQHVTVLVVLALVVPVFSFGHAIDLQKWKIKVFLTFLWGVAAVLLYVQFTDVWLNTGLHILCGTFFIRKGIIYAK